MGTQQFKMKRDQLCSPPALPSTPILSSYHSIKNKKFWAQIVSSFSLMSSIHYSPLLFV